MQTLNARDCAIVHTWMARDRWLLVFRDLSLPIYLCFYMDIQHEPEVRPVGAPSTGACYLGLALQHQRSPMPKTSLSFEGSALLSREMLSLLR